MRRCLPLVLGLAACGAPAVPAVPPPPEARLSPPPPPRPEPPPPRDPAMGPHGEKAALDGRRLNVILVAGGERSVEPEDLHPPPGDRSLRGLVPTTLLFLDDGTLLAGASDGTVTALDGDLHRRAWIGLRGAVAGLAPAGEGMAAVTTDRGVIALVTRDGEVRWERQVTAEPLGRPLAVPGRAIVAASERAVFALSLSGDALFARSLPPAVDERPGAVKGDDVRGWAPPNGTFSASPPYLSVDGDAIQAGYGPPFRLDDAHPPAPGLAPTFPLAFHRVIEGEVTSVLAGGPGEAWALVRKKPPGPDPDELLLPPFEFGYGDEYRSDRYELVHVEGARITRLAVPHEGSRKELFLDRQKRPEAGALMIDRLAAGPGGAPWILARRISAELSVAGEDGYVGPQYGAGEILEVRGGAVRERADLAPTFFDHIAYEPLAEAPSGPARLLCFGARSPACAEVSDAGARPVPSPGRVVALASLGDGAWALTNLGALYRRDGASGFVPLPGPQGAVLHALAGASEADVWGAAGEPYQALHFDGKGWSRVPLPVESVPGFVARAADDVWTGNGRARWDGRGWSRVYGAPRGPVAARAADEVWIGGDGLWHGTAPGPVPVRLPPAREAPRVPASTAIALGPPDAGWSVVRARFALGKGAAMTSARGVSASPEGVVWLQSWDRLVEVDGDRATTLREVRREGFGRWAQPEAAGKGWVLDRWGAGRVEGGGDALLDRQEAVAVHGNGLGVTWVVGRPLLPSTEEPHPYELSPHALVIAGGAPRPVLGIPSAAWCDVAVASDGGAWLAGGLGDGPSGEGILFGARGPFGARGATRLRAPATLLAVSASGADEAWAVGAAGTIVHVRGDEVTTLSLPSGAWLRAVLVRAPDDVWIGGDGGTLLHHDGRALHPVAHPLGPDASFTGLAFARGVVWAVSPSGILRIQKAREGG